ncbi:MAG: hypothetical protein V1742_01020, partial [Pseudomonadota bacterium]
MYSALSARIDADSPWEFWRTRPHDDPETTYKRYLKLVDYYLYRKFDSIESAMGLAKEALWLEGKARTAPHSLEVRVGVVKKLLVLSRKRNLC